MFTLLVIIANSAFVVVKADLVLKPCDTEAVIGNSTYFDCASNVETNEVNWYYYAVGAKHHEDICLYCLGKIHPHYENRIQIKRNVTNNYYQLMIKSVQRRDAGTYTCQDNGGIGESASAQLVVLESSPTCTSNIKPDGVLGPNDCGLEPDTLQLSCHVSYHGNIPPVIKWRKVRTEDPIIPSFCQNTDSRVTCNLTTTVDLCLNGASYICETNRSITTQYKCASDIIRVIYAKSDNSTKITAEGDEEKVYCSVNSSLSCPHTWKWFDGVYEEVVTYGSPLITSKPGWHKCEAECNIRGRQCTVVSKLVHITEQKNFLITVTIAVSLVSIIAVALVIVAVICIRLRKSAFKLNRWRRQDQTVTKRLNGEFERPADVYEPSNIVVTTKASKEKGLLIRGMTILDNELFAVTQRCSEVEVFDCKTLIWKRQWTQTELIRPADITSCKASRPRCLYIVDWKGDTVKKEVICVDPNGTLLRKWETGYDYGDLISVTNNKNIIVTCLGKNEFNEYSPDGIMIRKISPQDVDAPTHAIKLISGDFVVSSGDVSHLLHRVCIVGGVDGKIKQSFGAERGSDLKHMDHPIYLAVYNDGSVAVLENGNRRVLLLDKDLKFKRVLLSQEKSGLQNPSRLLLDETNRRLFVVDRHNNAGAILVFQIKETL